MSLLKCPGAMSPNSPFREGYESDTETLFEVPSSPPISLLQISKPQIPKRGIEWRKKLLNGIAERIRITKLKLMGKTKDEIVDREPGYYYDPEYHELDNEPWFRRNKSMSDLSSAVGTAAGYSAWEVCGESCLSTRMSFEI